MSAPALARTAASSYPVFWRIIVADDDRGLLETGAQLVAAHTRALLSGIPDERNPERAALIRVLKHRARIVRRDDRHPAVARSTERQLRRVRHRARVERRDLIALHVSAAEERRGELVWHLLDERRVDARRLEPPAVVIEVLSCRAHQPRSFAEQRQRIRDIGRAAAPPLVHRVDEKAQAHALHVLRQEVLCELPREGHQVIEGDGTGHNY
jgi:hypothetical protein